MDYGINIGVGFTGLSRLNAAVNQIERINAAVDNLNANPLTLFKKGRGSASDEVASLNTAVMDLVRSFTNGERKLGGTFASVAAQAASFGDILEQVDGTFTNISSTAAKRSGLDQLAKLFGEATLQAEKFAAAQEKIRQQGIAAAQSTGGAPGKFTVLGSPEAIQQQGIFEAKIAEQRKKNAKNDLMFQRLRLEVLTSQARILEEQVRSSSRIGRLAADKRVQSAAISGGFPVLFGGGPGAVLGGGIGGFFGDFAGGIAGSAIGQTFDQLVERANAIGNAIGALDFDTLEQSGVRVNAGLQLQIEKLQELRQFKEAEALLSEEVNAQVGTLPGTIEDAANAGNLLGNEFQKLLNSVGATLAIVGAPFAAALALIVKIVNDLVKTLNKILSAVGFVIKEVTRLTLEFFIGKDAVESINNALANSSGNLKKARLEAAEFRRELEGTYAGLNEQVVALKQNLKFERQRQTGVDDQSRLENLALEKRIALQAAFDKKIAERTKLREQNLLTEEAANLIESRYQIERELAEERYQNKVETFNANSAKKSQREDERKLRAIEQRIKATDRELARAANAFSRVDDELTDIINKNKDKVAFEREYAELIRGGSTPAAAQQAIELKKQLLELDRRYEKEIKALDAQLAKTELVILEQIAVDGVTDAIKRQIEEYNRLKGVRDGLADTKEGAEGAINEALAPKSDRERLQEYLDKLQEQLNDLNDPVKQITSLAETLGSAFSESFKGIVDGSMSAREALANLFQRTADHFLDMAAKMIATQIQMKILGIGLNFLAPGVPSGFSPSSPDIGGTFGVTPKTADLDFSGAFSGRALGGAVGAGRPYMVGERGPELFIPGAQGNIVPNNAMGGSNIVVNVDASGSSVEGDSDQAAQLGKMLGAAVQAELVKQKRPGGLLAS